MEGSPYEPYEPYETRTDAPRTELVGMVGVSVRIYYQDEAGYRYRKNDYITVYELYERIYLNSERILATGSCNEKTGLGV